MSLSIRNKLYAGFGLIALLLVVTAAVALVQVRVLGDKLDQFSDSVLPTEFAVWRAHFNMVQLRDQLPILAAMPADMRAGHLERMSELETAIAADIDELRRQPVLDAQALAALDDAERLLSEWYVVRDAGPIALINENRGMEATDEALHGAVATTYDIADAAIVDFHMKFRGIVEATQASAATFVDRMTILIIAIIIVAVTAAGFVAVGLSRRITGTLSGIVGAMVNLSSEVLPKLESVTRSVASGNLTSRAQMDVARIDNTSDDELGQIAESYNAMVAQLENIGKSTNDMVDNLRLLIGEIGTTAGDLTEASSGLADAAERAGDANSVITVSSHQLSEGADQQAHGVELTNTAVQGLSDAIRQISKGSEVQADGADQAAGMVSQVSMAISDVARTAQEAAEGSTQASQAAEKGASMVDQTIEGMSRIREAVNTTSQRISQLGDQSTEIGNIVAVIDDIAAQTNLLALNAAIEAARAGEQGRGFAVVADEVRGLAERVAQATREITVLIDNIQNGVTESISAVEAGTAQAEEGVRLAEEAGGALNDISRSVTGVASQIETISASAEEVSASADEMVRAIEGVSAITQQNSASTQQMAASSGEVVNAIEEISTISNQNIATSQEVNASVGKMSDEVEQVLESSQSLDQMARKLQEVVTTFRVTGEGGSSPRRSTA